MAKNEKAKTRPLSNPYEIYQNSHGWTWLVVKHYQSPEAEAKNPLTRVFTYVTSPYCEEGEYGDSYLSEITGDGGGRLVSEAVLPNGKVVRSAAPVTV